MVLPLIKKGFLFSPYRYKSDIFMGVNLSGLNPQFSQRAALDIIQKPTLQFYGITIPIFKKQPTPYLTLNYSEQPAHTKMFSLFP